MGTYTAEKVFAFGSIPEERLLAVTSGSVLVSVSLDGANFSLIQADALTTASRIYTKDMFVKVSPQGAATYQIQEDKAI